MSDVLAASRFLVVGAGGIGGVITASLSEIGHDVTAVTTNQAIHDAVVDRGMKVVGEGAPRSVKAKVSLGVAPLIERGEKFDYVLLATQPPQVEEAARQALPLLGDDGAMVCLQNGLCERRIAKIAGDDRVIGAVVGWGATMPEPGLYEKTAAGGFTLGYPAGEPFGSDHDDLVAALEAVGPVETTQNLPGKRWSKLAINCAISALGTVGGDRLGALMQHRIVRRLALEIMTETVHVARKENVRLEKVSGTLDLNWIALTEEEAHAAGSPSLVAKHTLLLAVGLRYRRMKSSMLSAIERGRTPAVDFLNGEVALQGKRHGVSTPVNTTMRDTVWAIADGKKTPGVDLLREVYEATGPHGA
ncbi:MAG: 2-dehydropantoate 2-reductase [Labilithrix sp.]|nr:2-dehydropantoate 2-reductase [Labilithrix sp.]MCW5811782.1 2-dehydropantoate 2-reductase [Labilithrix sp.]